MEIDDLTCQYVPTGCAVEVSMLNFLEFLGTPDIRNLLIMKARNTEMVVNIPFCPTRKIMTVAFKITQGGQENVRVVTKGAAEEVLHLCTQELNGNAEVDDFDGETQMGEPFKEKIIDSIAKGGTIGRKPIMFAYKDMSVAAFEAIKKANGDFEDEESRQALEKDLILLAVFGLEDEERGETKKVINEFKKSKCNTRIVSGDHKDCVLKLAAHFNLYSEGNDSDFAKANNLKKAVSGAEF